MGKANSKSQLIQAIRKEDEDTITRLIEQDPSLLNSYINKSEDHTAICMAIYFNSFNSVKLLINV